MKRETLKEGKIRVLGMMKSYPEQTMKIYETLKEQYESIGKWNEKLVEFHLYHFCKSILLDKKLDDILDED